MKIKKIQSSDEIIGRIEKIEETENGLIVTFCFLKSVGKMERNKIMEYLSGINLQRISKSNLLRVDK
jgi:hypothetical protein